MTSKLLAGVSALVLALAMSPSAMAGSASGNTANGDGNDTVTASDDDTMGSGNQDGSNNTTLGVELGDIGVSVSVQTLTHSNTGQSFLAPVVGENAEANMNASIGGSTAQNAAGVIQTNAQTGFQTQLQQGSSMAAVGTVNIGGGGNE